MFGIGGTKEADPEVEALTARVQQLERALHTLIDLELKSSCAQSTRGGSRGGDPLPALEPFVTRRDPMRGQVTKRGVGDSLT